MKKEIYYQGENGGQYRVWKGRTNGYSCGISEKSPMLAEARLTSKTEYSAMELGSEVKALTKAQLDKKIKNLAMNIKMAGKEIAADKINKDYL